MTSAGIIGFLVIVALWRRDEALYLIASIPTIVFGLMYRGTHDTLDGLVISIAVVSMGIFLLIMAIYNIVLRFKN